MLLAQERVQNHAPLKMEPKPFQCNYCTRRFKMAVAAGSHARFLHPLSYSKQDTYELLESKGHFVSFEQQEAFVAKMKKKISAATKPKVGLQRHRYIIHSMILILRD